MNPDELCPSCNRLVMTVAKRLQAKMNQEGYDFRPDDAFILAGAVGLVRAMLDDICKQYEQNISETLSQ